MLSIEQAIQLLCYFQLKLELKVYDNRKKLYKVSILIFILAPSPPRNLKEVSVNSTSVQLQWEVPAQTNGQLRTYQLQFKIKFSDTGSHGIS